MTLNRLLQSVVPGADLAHLANPGALTACYVALGSELPLLLAACTLPLARCLAFPVMLGLPADAASHTQPFSLPTPSISHKGGLVGLTGPCNGL